jgi:hypothetical protein
MTIGPLLVVKMKLKSFPCNSQQAFSMSRQIELLESVAGSGHQILVEHCSLSLIDNDDIQQSVTRMGVGYKSKIGADERYVHSLEEEVIPRNTSRLKMGLMKRAA